MALLAGQRVGPYVIESLLGMGGMGEVYRARDERLRRVVALKVVRADREDRTGVAPDDRLIAEARAAAALRHPNVVEIFDAGRDDGRTYVAMEYIEGKPLRAYVGDASVPLATRKRWIVEIARALAAAHRAGLVHRDVKPENVLIDAEGAARVLDFGLAKRVVHDSNAPTANPALETATGRVVGTLSYMAPEQLAGAPPDARWDQYAWGVLAYELLTGTHPRQTVAMPGARAHMTQTPKMPNELVPEIPFSDASAVMLAMAPDPARRFASMDAALDAMREGPSQAPATTTTTRAVETSRATPRPLAPAPRAPRRWPIVVGLVAAMLVGVAIGQLSHQSRTTNVVPSATSVAPQASSVASAIVAPPSASAPPVASSAASSSARAVTRPTDYTSDCTCNGEDGQLCPFGSKLQIKTCDCVAQRSVSLFDDAGSNQRVGAGLANGQTCSGVALVDVEQGTLVNCEYDCPMKAYSGVHRTPCRGLDRRTGAPRDGVLFCY